MRGRNARIWGVQLQWVHVYVCCWPARQSRDRHNVRFRALVCIGVRARGASYYCIPVGVRLRDTVRCTCASTLAPVSSCTQWQSYTMHEGALAKGRGHITPTHRRSERRRILDFLQARVQAVGNTYLRKVTNSLRSAVGRVGDSAAARARLWQRVQPWQWHERSVRACATVKLKER